MNSIPVYCFDWHINQSSAQDEILIKPLSPYIKFDVTSWDGVHLEVSKKAIQDTPLVFFLFPPPPNLLADPNAKLVWIPMWDVTKKYRDKWWRKLPKSLRVVSLSEEISQRTLAAELPTLTLKYYKDPNEMKPASWEGPNSLFYWNRTGLVGREFLEKICCTLEIDILYFRRRIDPGWPSWCDYDLPEMLGKTEVKQLDLGGISGFEQYMENLNKSNIFLAPRQSEGVGLSFLEAMAKGCAVFAYNAPTMNEYIEHNKDGYLLASDPFSEFLSHREKLVQQVYRFLFASRSAGRGVLHPLFRHPITARQNWGEIAKLDLQVIGENARSKQLNGFKVWQDSLERFASFITNW